MHKLTEYCIDALDIIVLIKRAKAQKTKAKAIDCYSGAICMQGEMLIKHPTRANIDDFFLKKLDFAIKTKTPRKELESISAMLVESYNDSFRVVRDDLPPSEYEHLNVAMVDKGIDNDK